MPGITFAPGGPAYSEPPAGLRENIETATKNGTGFVFLHHAIAGWPAWEGYAELMGGRFCYTRQRVRGADVADSGYRHKVEHRVRVMQEHPVTRGVDAEFPMIDELYLYEVFEDSVTPLLRSSHEFVASNFYSAEKVVVDGEMINFRSNV